MGSLKKVLIVLVSLVLALVAFLVLRNVFSDPSSSSSSSLENVTVLDDGSTLQVGKPVPAGAVPSKTTVTVFVDGWTVANYGAEASYVKGFYEKPLVFEPVSKADIDSILATSPGLISNLYSYMVDAHTPVSCSSEGCSDLDPYWILNPGEVPTFGSIYSSAGMKSLLWKAEVSADPSTEVYSGTPEEVGSMWDPLLAGQPVTSITVNWSGTQNVQIPLFVSDNPTPSGEKNQEGEVDQGVSLEPSAFNGWFYNRWLVSASFGKTFMNTPLWNMPPDENNKERVFSEPDRSLLNESEASRVYNTLMGSNQVPFFNRFGTGFKWPAFKDFNESQMTSFSAPSLGCYGSALCQPGVLQTPSKPERSQMSYLKVCDAKKNYLVLGMQDLIFSTDSKYSIFQGPSSSYNPSDIKLTQPGTRMYYKIIGVYNSDAQYPSLQNMQVTTSFEPLEAPFDGTLDSIFFQDTSFEGWQVC